jgi:hypothetical protein
MLEQGPELILGHPPFLPRVRRVVTRVSFQAVRGPDTVWEIVFLMVILKIPIVYLCTVVYYAIKAEPKPEEGAAVTAGIGPEDTGPGWSRRRSRIRPRRPHGGPARSYPRTAHARTYAERR